MSYDSAILFKIDEQENVTLEAVIQFINVMRKTDLLPFSDEISGHDKPLLDYFYFDEETDDEEDDSIEVNSLDSIEEFMNANKWQFCSIHVTGWNDQLKSEVDSVFEKLEAYDESDLKPSWKFSYGFGNVLDPVGGDYEGWSFFIDTSDYVPESRILEEVFAKDFFSKQTLVNEIRESLVDVFNSKVSIDACLTG